MCFFCENSINHEFPADYSGLQSDQADHPVSSGTMHQTGAEDYSNAATDKPFYSWDQAGDQISRWDAKWDGGNFGTSGSATYSFDGGTANGFFPMTASARALIVDALRIISEVADITFTWADSGNFNTTNSENGELIFHQYGTSPYGGGYGGWGGRTYFGDEATTITSGYANMGGESLSLFLHEIGHAIGLAHPGNYNGGGNSYQNDAIFWNDTNQYTVMSYWSETLTGADFNGRDVTGLMMYDIAALQRLYGENTSTRSGDTVYGFNATALDSIDGSIDEHWLLSNQSDDIVGAVWDTGGIDTLDLSGFSSDSQVDLREEAFSSFGGLTSNFSIARNVTIENAIGGTGNDTLLGNEANNVLTGGAGQDHIDGGAGYDTVSYLGTSVGIYVELYLDRTSSDGFGSLDTLINIESVVGSGSNDIIVADENNNALAGGAGVDIMFAGYGDDYLSGGAGGDYLNGSFGSDQFAFSISDFAAGAWDGIADFSQSAGNFDYLRFDGLSAADLMMVDYNGHAIVSTVSLAYSGGIVVYDTTVAELQDQLLFY